MPIEEVLAAAREGMTRLTPVQACREITEGALLIDTRTATHRMYQGELPGAIIIDRTVLEWRLDPTSASRVPEATSADLRIIVACRHGYSSSLAAASLRAIGLHRATDIVGGVEAWLRDGLPIHSGAVDIRQ